MRSLRLIFGLAFRERLRVAERLDHIHSQLLRDAHVGWVEARDPPNACRVGRGTRPTK